MDNSRIFKMAFGAVYPLYVMKVEKKGRTRQEVDSVICWLTGYSEEALQERLGNNCDFETFFARGASNESEFFAHYRSCLRSTCGSD